MAQSLETLRNSVIDSIKGRKLGISSDNFLVGQNGIKRTVQDLTSASSATSLNRAGLINYTGTSLATSAANAGGTLLLPLPIPGVDVTICNINAATSAASPGSTALMLIRPSTSFVIYSSEGTTMTTINLTPGSAVTLAGVTTGIFQVVNRTSLAGTPINGTT